MYRTLSRPTLAVLLTLTLVGSLVIGGGVVAQQSAVEHTDESPTQETTYLRVVHASPDAPAVDIYINESTMNDSVDNESMPTNDSVDNESAPTNDSVDNETSMNDSVDNESTLMNVTLTNVSFSNASEYLTLEAGTYNITITAAGDREAVVYEDTVTLDARTVTTLVASGEISETATEGEVDENATDASENATESEADENTNASANASTPLELVAYDDNALRPTANDSALRIVHLSPDAPTVDVTTANGTVLADGLSFQESSGYMTVPAGDHEVQIRADTPDQNGTVVATVNVSVEAGTAYSAMALGYTNATEEQTPFEVAMTEDATRTVHIPSEAENETETN